MLSYACHPPILAWQDLISRLGLFFLFVVSSGLLDIETMHGDDATYLVLLRLTDWQFERLLILEASVHSCPKLTKNFLFFQNILKYHVTFKLILF